MNVPTLQRASVFSLLAHVVFLFLVVLATKRAAVVAPRVYTVNIVTPEVSAPEKAVRPRAEARAEKPAPGKVSKPPQRLPPKKSLPPERKPLQPARDAVSPDYLADRLETLRARKERDETVTESLDRIETRKRLETIRQRAFLRGDPAEQTGGGPEQARIDAELALYLDRVHDRIYDEWVFPEMDLEGLEATILLTIMRSGRIVVNRFERSSGNQLFDRSALKAVQKASPVEPPPFGRNLQVGVNFIPHVIR
jgi:colicin import membrane protein